ncbi:MAG: hypothetical protein ISS74_05110 [Planctomycetes bacterium]|nr:hypothetical protein [Planctomycetota bacterium]
MCQAAFLEAAGRTMALAAAMLIAIVGMAAPAASGEPDITFVEEGPEPDAGASPASPFGPGREGPSRDDGVPGYVELSTGLKVPGHIYTTRAKRLKVYNIRRQVYEYIPVPALRSVEVVIEWEREEKQWRFKEAGNPEKVYTGKSYPVRSLAWRLTLRNGHEVVGHMLGEPIYAEHSGKRERFILHQRDKGPLDATLKDLVYIRRIEFGPKAYNKAVDELARKAAEAGKGGSK